MARISEAARREVRQRLIASAADHFARDGLQGANVNRISVDAGYAKGTIYNYFPSKEALFEAVLGEAAGGAAERFLAGGPEGSVRDRLAALVAEDVAEVRAHEAFAKVFVREALTPDSPWAGAILGAVQPLLAIVHALLEEAVRGGELTGDPTALTGGFGDLMLLAYVRQWRPVPAMAWEEVPQWVVSAFFDGAPADPPGRALAGPAPGSQSWKQ